MSEETKIVDFNLFIDESIADDFKRVCEKNDVSAKMVLETFMKDYIVSGGHPEQVTGGMPWNANNTRRI